MIHVCTNESRHTYEWVTVHIWINHFTNTKTKQKKNLCDSVGCTNYNTLQHTVTHCNTLHHCNTLLHTKNLHDNVGWDDLQHAATQLQHIATHCNTLQHTATHCNTQRTCAIAWASTIAAAKWNTVLQCVAVCWRVLQSVAVCMAEHTR